MSILPFFAISQVEITLNIHQPPELDFNITKQDTTIVTGESVKIGDEIIVFGGSGDYHYTWFPDESLDNPLIINPVASPEDTTTYQLTVTDDNGCSFSVAYTVNVRETPNSSNIITADELPLNVILYPNPNTGIFRVRLKGLPAEKIELNIVDIRGRHMFKSIISDFYGEHTEIMQQDLASGTYILEVKSDATNLRTQFIIHKYTNL